MKIAEMHVWFRQYAQQMGMQNVRAILPEQIDNLINTSTKDVIDEIVKTNVGTTNDRIITDNAKLASINALRTLYKVDMITIKEGGTVNTYKNEPYTFDSTRINSGSQAPLYFVDFAIRYADREINEDNKQDVTYTRWFPIRIVDDAYLADILNDWVLAPRMRTPVMVVYAMDGGTKEVISNHSQFEVYFGENEDTGLEKIVNTKWLGQIRCSFIKHPNEVRYVSDVTGNSEDNIDSDLPIQLQIPMLKHAVDLYRATIQGSLFATQGQQQAQQQEIARNNARPTNEGYQS